MLMALSMTSLPRNVTSLDGQGQLQRLDQQGEWSDVDPIDDEGSIGVDLDQEPEPDESWEYCDLDGRCIDVGMTPAELSSHMAHAHGSGELLFRQCVECDYQCMTGKGLRLHLIKTHQVCPHTQWIGCEYE